MIKIEAASKDQNKVRILISCYFGSIAVRVTHDRS